MNRRIKKKIAKRVGHKTYQGMYADWVKTQIDGCEYFVGPYIEKLQSLAPDKYKAEYKAHKTSMLKVITLIKYKWPISSRNASWITKHTHRSRKRELFKISHPHGAKWYIK